MKKYVLIFFALILIIIQPIKAQVKPFQKGDRISFFGNSITEAGFYESNIWLYYMTHFPERQITIFNNGIGGDVVGQMNERFEEDVLVKDPNIVILTFGMNDSGYFEFHADDADEVIKEKIEKSFSDFKLMQQKLIDQQQIRPIIMSSSPYDETVQNEDNYFPGKFEAMEQIAAFQKEGALENGWPYVDILYPMTEINLRQQQLDPTFTLTGPDRIHPGKAGHLVMAAIFLENQGLAGKPVSYITIDTEKGLLKSDNAVIKVDKRAHDGLSFSYHAKSLPFPIDSVSSMWENPQKQSDALNVYPFIEKFNQEILQVKNLKKGNYSLIIDGRIIHTFSADSLERGVNMALLGNTPQYQQAKEVMHLNDLRAELEKKFREYYWLQFNYFDDQNLLFEDSQLAFDKVTEKAKTDVFINSKINTYQTFRFREIRKMWEDNITKITERIYQINRPKIHQIELVAVK